MACPMFPRFFSSAAARCLVPAPPAAAAAAGRAPAGRAAASPGRCPARCRGPARRGGHGPPGGSRKGLKKRSL